MYEKTLDDIENEMIKLEQDVDTQLEQGEKFIHLYKFKNYIELVNKYLIVMQNKKEDKPNYDLFLGDSDEVPGKYSAEEEAPKEKTKEERKAVHTHPPKDDRKYWGLLNQNDKIEMTKTYVQAMREKQIKSAGLEYSMVRAWFARKYRIIIPPHEEIIGIAKELGLDINNIYIGKDTLSFPKEKEGKEAKEESEDNVDGDE